MKIEEALKRIEELERRVRELEAQPKQEFHYHYSQPWPVYPQWPQVTWGTTSAVGDMTGANLAIEPYSGWSIQSTSHGANTHEPVKPG